MRLRSTCFWSLIMYTILDQEFCDCIVQFWGTLNMLLHELDFCYFSRFIDCLITLSFHHASSVIHSQKFECSTSIGLWYVKRTIWRHWWQVGIYVDPQRKSSLSERIHFFLVLQLLCDVHYVHWCYVSPDILRAIRKHRYINNGK